MRRCVVGNRVDKNGELFEKLKRKMREGDSIWVTECWDERNVCEYDEVWIDGNYNNDMKITMIELRMRGGVITGPHADLRMEGD